ncbi:MFS transporter [Bhargavaea ginsengi]|uniref:MFS transporter n=1 Tax=Bhargavaea ginsengi TaxID=426757 RepID=UPI00204160B8|nr:MFS transporter [Bhargavaea ginsengi]MCM3087462.1 MFS transporter [Bhargavaea ginsengi]
MGSHSIVLRQSWTMLLWLLVVQILVAFAGRSIAPLSILIGYDLNLTNSQIGMLTAALFLGQAMIAIPSGYLSDTVSSRTMLILVATCVTGAFIAMSLLPYFGFVLLCITVAGLGYGAMHPTANKGIFFWFPEKRGIAMGIKQMGVTFGSALAAIILLPLGEAYGWKISILTSAVLLITGGLLASFFYKEPAGIGRVSAKERGWKNLFSGLSDVAKNRPLLLISLAAMGLTGIQMTFNTYLVIYSHEFIGISLTAAAGLLVISEVAGSLGRIGWGIISDTLFQSRRIIILILVTLISAVFITLISILPAGTPYYVLAVIAAVLGFCIAGYNGIWMNSATEVVPKERVGLSTGFTLTIGSCGVLFVPPLFGMMVDISHSFQYAWWFLLALLMLVLISLKLASGIEKQQRLKEAAHAD